MSHSSIIYTNPTSTLLILDIPTSIEFAQDNPSNSSPTSAFTRRLISSPPLEKPYPSTEPKTAKARAKLPEASIEDLLLQKHIQFALEEVKGVVVGEWCLPRMSSKNQEGYHSEANEGHERKRRKLSFDHILSKTETADPPSMGRRTSPPPTTIFFQNVHPTTTTLLLPSSSPSPILHHIPLQATLLLGPLTQTLPTFLLHAPLFNLIILDPPWPNRSARRSKHYGISYGRMDIYQLLKEVPVREKLAEDGVVAVWVTNREGFGEMILGKEGLFSEWGVDFVEEWIWVKLTKHGEPLGPLDGVWRKPYEKLLIGRRKPTNSKDPDRGLHGNSEEEEDAGVKRRIIFAVPDLHSRKPNLKELMERCLGLGKEGRYEALEVFARNMTAGWWSWGDEGCKFQGEEYWTEEIKDI